jgi:hypothetical protein
MHLGRLTTGAEGDNVFTAEVPHDSFSHLRAGAVVSTEEEDAGWWTNPRRIAIRAIPDAQDGVKRRTSGEIARPEQIEIETIVDIAAIGRAPSFSHQMLIPELLEMV